jgi:hypothetical protein
MGSLSNSFFYFSKTLVRDGTWARLSKASKAIFPVINIFRGIEGLSYPSEQTIGKYAGLVEKQVRLGVSGLCGLPGIRVERRTTIRGNHSKNFIITLPLPKKSFSFSRAIIESNVWSGLSSSAKSLYPVLRSLSFFDPELYQGLYETRFANPDIDTFRADFPSRLFDFCDRKAVELCKLAGIHRGSFGGAVLELIKEHLLIKESGLCLVYHKPYSAVDFDVEFFPKPVEKLPVDNVGKNLSDVEKVPGSYVSKISPKQVILN